MDIFDELVEELKQKAKTRFELQHTFEPEHSTAVELWVRLDVVVECLNKLKQNHILIPKAKIGELLEIISDAHSLKLKLKKFVDGLLRENEG